jgi:C4-dicarboxylate-specific signal transduction histidine kinase
MLVTLALLLTASLSAWRLYADFRALATSDLRLTELAGRIIHLDEVLTMSARMAATTGDPSWEARYRRFEPELDAAIKETLAIAPEAYSSSAATTTDAANIALVALERQAFALIREGKLVEARRILESAEYDHHKHVYAAGMSTVMDALRNRVAQRVDAFGRRVLFAVGIGLALLVVLVACWWRIVALIHGYLGARDALERRVQERTTELSASHAELSESLRVLNETQRQLLDASRRSGMADVATAVLHNVGNALNTINVSTSMIRQALRQSSIARLGRIAHLLDENRGDIATFLADGERGAKVIDYLLQLAHASAAEQTHINGELATLEKSVDHVKTIVHMQQSHARIGGVHETLLLSQLLDDALQLLFASCERHDIHIERDFVELPPVTVDRHKVFQIVLNLLSNARDALKETTACPRKLVLRSRRIDDESFAIEVVDNGQGIRAEHAERIFRHGFTTKEEGHGFGLHASACAAAELGGSLSCHSDGEGRGATFTLLLPATLAA